MSKNFYENLDVNACTNEGKYPSKHVLKSAGINGSLAAGRDFDILNYLNQLFLSHFFWILYKSVNSSLKM